MKDNWQKDIHDRLGNYEKDEPKGLWEDIRKEMAGTNGGYIRNSKSSVSFRLLRMASVAAAASVALFLGYSIYSQYTYSEWEASELAGQHVYTKSIKSSVKSSFAAGDSNDFMADNSSMPYITDMTVKSENGKEMSSSVSDGRNSSKTTSWNNDENKVKNPNEATTTIDKKKVADSDNGNENVKRYNSDNNYTNLVACNSDATRYSSPSTSSRWTVATSAMGAMGTTKNIMSIGSPVTVVGPDDSDWEDNPMLGINIFNQGKDVKTEYKHHIPVRIGFKVAYAFNERLSIESGLTYTRLSSDMQEGTEENHYTGEQKLNYVGIPVNVKYNVCSYKRFDLYGYAGVLAEKCVSGSITQEYVINNMTKKTEKTDIDSKPLQMSVNASVGVQLNVLDNIGIYAEPGISYYFDDRSLLQTIYKEKPLNFNITVGMRYTLGR